MFQLYDYLLAKTPIIAVKIWCSGGRQDQYAKLEGLTSWFYAMNTCNHPLRIKNWIILNLHLHYSLFYWNI